MRREGAGDPARPIALHAYEALAERFADQVDQKPHNAFYDRPAVLSLVPDLNGKRILDAGCGPGAYAEILADRGADVLGVDVSPRMVARAERRLEGRARIRVWNLEEPLTFAESGEFDGVLAPLSLEYIRDLGPLFREFRRILRDPGWVVASVGHPFGNYLRHPRGSYFESRPVREVWRGFGGAVEVPFYRRPLGETVGPLLQAGFHIDRLIEPLPTEEFRRRDPKSYAAVLREPGFLAFRAVTVADRPKAVRPG
jgi:SAM-dependent methyltransferase